MKKSILLRLRLHPSPLWVIFEVNFLRNLASATLTAIFPIYFRQFVASDAAVSFIYFIGYCAATLSSLYSSYIIEHLRKRKSLIIALLTFTILFAAFAVIAESVTVFIVFAFYQFILSLFILDISLYIKHYSNFQLIAENAGKLGSFSNIGWLVGPFLGALIADRFSLEAAFLVSAVISLIALVTFFFVRLSHEEMVVIPHERSFAKNIKHFFRNQNLRRTYINTMGLGVIYSIWDMLPLLMLHINAPLPVIGMTKTLMGVPQAIFEFPIGRMADRETGERKIFIIGYTLLAVFTALLGFTENLRLFITFFFIAAIGSSFVEMTRDSYFFRQMKEENIELVSVYRTSDTLPFMVGQGLAAASLLFIPIEWWFFIGGCLGMFFVFNAYRLKELPRAPLAPKNITASVASEKNMLE